MRRNLLTYILWFSAIILFLLHLVLIHRQDESQFTELVNKQEREVKTSNTAGKSLNKYLIFVLKTFFLRTIQGYDHKIYIDNRKLCEKCSL